MKLPLGGQSRVAREGANIPRTFAGVCNRGRRLLCPGYFRGQLKPMPDKTYGEGVCLCLLRDI